jgi:hypothetical protein
MPVHELARQSGLSGAAWAGQRQQAGTGDKVVEVVQVLLAT